MLKKIQFTLILILLFSFSSLYAKEQLIFAIDLIRHGDRTPLHETPKDPYLWPKGLGELTAEGMNREYELGVAFRKKYVDELHLLPEQYQPNTIYIRSTDKDRTLASAECVLLGLYPTGPNLPNSDKSALPHSYQPIPIHSVPVDSDPLLQTHISKNPILWLEFQLNLRKEWDKLDPEFKNKIKHWSQLTGMPLNSLKELKSLADILYVRQRNNVPLPQGISKEDAKQIIDIGKGSMISYFKNKAVSYPMGHTFLLSVAKHLREASAQKSPLKYVLFSAHDSTIMSVMNTMGAPLEEIPFYGSHLNFSLFEENNQFFITITYNNQPVNIPQCHGNKCTLEEFYTLAES